MLHVQHMEVPRLATSVGLCHSNAGSICVFHLHHSSRQCQSLNSLSSARDWTHNLMIPTRICFCCTMTGTPVLYYYYYYYHYYYYYFAFQGCTSAYGRSQARGRIGVAAASLHHSHSNAGSEPSLQLTPQLTAMLHPLIHWIRPGIEPISSWLLVRFVSAAPQQNSVHFFKIEVLFTWDWPLTVLEGTVHWHSVPSRCCAAIASI